MKNRKTFIIDTSVLLYDKYSIHSFPQSDIIIPLDVLDELDRFKDRPGLLGESARYVNRYLDDLRLEGSLHKGIEIAGGQNIKVDVSNDFLIPSALSKDSADNRIIGLAASLKEKIKSTVIIITKDINFRVKCDALGIKAEDYYKDRIVDDKSEMYQGYIDISAESTELIDEFYDTGSLDISKLGCKVSPNQYVIVKCGKQSFLGVEKSGRIIDLNDGCFEKVRIDARNKEQKFALDLLSRKDIPLATITGLAGSGKTFLTLMAAISGLQEDEYERIVLTRTLEPVGKDIGFLPGDVNDKLDPWIGSIVDNYKSHFKDMTYFEMMRKKGQIEVAPLAFIRGRTFNNTFLIVDEAQNATIHELKTIITRVGENSKIVLLGDIGQIDTPYIDALSNGLTIVVEKLKGEILAGHITLLKGERSKIATLASKIL
jgi:PhoH-like ATPase